MRRERLIALLANPGAPQITALVAPPGYGKTTLLADWAAQEPRPVAWHTVTDLDNDPVRLLANLIAAYRSVGPVDPSLAGRLPSGSARLLAGPLPRLLASLSAWSEPAVLMLDDVHRIVDKDALDILSMLLDRHPVGFHVALAGRSSPDLPFARLRAQRMLQEIGTAQLALDVDEAAELVRLAGAELPAHVVRELTVRTEGWAAGIYLAVIGRAGTDDPLAIGAASASDRYIAEYLRAEIGRALSHEDLEFLTRTAILETVTPGAAAAVTGLDRPGERLERLAATNLLIAPVPGSVVAYRYHNVLREYLRSELERREPAAYTGVHATAAAYYAANGMDEPAIEHALASRDLDTAARYLAPAILPMYQQGQATLLMRWLERFSPSDLERAPMLTAVGAWLYLLEGIVERADLLGNITERADPRTLGRGAEAFRTLQSILRAIMGRHGYPDFMTTATRVYEDGAAPAHWRSVAATLLGIGHLHAPTADVDAADAALARALDLAPPTAASLRMTASATRAVIRLQAGDVAAAVPLVAQARAALAAVDGTATVTSLLVHAVDARVCGALGDIEGARQALVKAQLVRPLATHVAPWLSVPALLELAHGYLIVSDPAGAQIALRHAEDIVRRRPGLGGLVNRVLELRTMLSDASDVLAGSSTLTTAELRVLPLLPTYLSFEEIGERLNVSRNTVKTHAMSIYGKLWASSRGEAVERAVELGLLEPYPVLRRRVEPDKLGGDHGSGTRR